MAKACIPGCMLIEGPQVDGKWSAISCGACGANASRRHGEDKLYKGLLGLHNHVKVMHKNSIGVNIDAFLHSLRRREFSDAEVLLMEAGEAPRLPIEINFGDRSMTDRASAQAHSERDSTATKAAIPSRPREPESNPAAASEEQPFHKKCRTESEIWQQIEDDSVMDRTPTPRKRVPALRSSQITARLYEQHRH